MSSDTYAVPLSTMSTTVFQALGDNLSDGDMKLPAALLMIMLGSPNVLIHWSTADFTSSGERTSAASGRTLNADVTYLGTCISF